MVKRIGTDWGLNVRMVITLFLLACVYLLFMGALYYFGVNFGLIVVVALALAVAQYYWSDKLILLSLGAQEVTEQQAPQLHDMVSRLAAMTGLPKPKVALIDSPVPNAMATGRNPDHSLVAVTTGILGMLTPEEMEAVLAHEMSHVIHRDMRVMAMASFFATVASFIVQSGMWGGMYGGYGRRDNRDNGSSFMLIFLVSIVVWAISFVLIRTLSRYREYSADRGSAIITGQPSQLASALVKISGRMQRIPDQDLRQVEAGNTLMIFPAISRGSISEIFSTHPSLEHRLAKLQEMEAALAH
ncbi:MAG TPA: zinc metalloprotease HtpX [Candidatus Dormibacteraeota bacterium]|nr:zinc metalloprotease HtpX [Candidatus Dormibacteraeota bacterium]